MRVLSVHNRYRSSSPSGESTVVDQEAAALVDRGHTVERFERFSDDIAALPLRRRALVPTQVVWHDETRRALARVLRASAFDVVHVHNTFPVLSPSVLYACRAEGVPVVLSLHNFRLMCARSDVFRDGGPCHDCVGRLPLPAIRHRCYRGSMLATLPVAAGVVAHRRTWRTLVSAYVFPSPSQRDLFTAYGLPPERVVVKPNLVRVPSVERSYGDDIVVYGGRLSTGKGIEVLMDAWDRRSADGDSRLRLVLAGDGPLGERVSSWAAARSSVEWVGILSRPDWLALLARASAVVVPSVVEETFGLTVVEAMALGVPAIASSRGSLRDMISHGVDGVLFEPADSVALAGVLTDVESHPARYVTMGDAARTTFQRRFDPDANVEQLLGIYRFAIENPAR